MEIEEGDRDRGGGSRSPTNGDQTDLEDTGVIEEEAGPLDYAISEEGIDFAIKKLKLNKAPGCDKILNEVLKTGKDIIKGHLLELFNRILSSGKYPTLWSFGLIVSIHKMDDRSKAENYRFITLLSPLGKLFTSILNDRLYDYMTKKGILKAKQGSFKKRHGSVDSIFILKSLIDKLVKSKPQKRRNLFFSCFVDFRKAFLIAYPGKNYLKKLRKEGIKGRFFSGAPARAKRAWDRAPYSWNMVNLFSLGFHVTDRAYVRTYVRTRLQIVRVG